MACLFHLQRSQERQRLRLRCRYREKAASLQPSAAKMVETLLLGGGRHLYHCSDSDRPSDDRRSATEYRRTGRYGTQKLGERRMATAQRLGLKETIPMFHSHPTDLPRDSPAGIARDRRDRGRSWSKRTAKPNVRTCWRQGRGRRGRGDADRRLRSGFHRE